jgi:hypothetical protein
MAAGHGAWNGAVRDIMDHATLYDTDFIGWTETQAALLRAAAADLPNAPIDWTHLAEEIEDLGNSEAAALASQVRRVIIHLLKLQFSPAQAPRRGWTETVGDARDAIADRLSETRSLRPRLAGLLDRERARAAKRAALDVELYGEVEAAARITAHGGAYTDEQILGDWFPDPTS